MDTPVVSVVICTLNRAPYLRGALESLVGQRLPGASWEVLVVDNGSTDDTADVAHAFERTLPLRYLVEPTLGLCHARDTGWREARGRIVAYLDDDAVASPGWLAAVHDVFTREPTTGVAGGPVRPIWEAPPPPWLSDVAARALTIVEWPDGPKRIADVRQEWLAGANMAAPRAVLEAVGGFHPHLDRIGHNMLSSGDVFLQQQVATRGWAVAYEPAMAVGHVVTRARLTKAWFRRRYFWQGISDAVMHRITHAPAPAACVREAIRRAARLLRSPAQLRALLLPTDDPDRFTEKCFAWIAVGHIAGLLHAARR
jgi:glycosyltransferase involved in cell wall biosynthesis